jgi:hypothetical protein
VLEGAGIVLFPGPQGAMVLRRRADVQITQDFAKKWSMGENTRAVTAAAGTISQFQRVKRPFIGRTRCCADGLTVIDSVAGRRFCGIRRPR